MRKYVVTIWDSLTGETSGHEVRIDPHPAVDLMASLHEYVCRTTGEDPAPWSMTALQYQSLGNSRFPVAGAAIFRNPRQQLSSVSFREVMTANSIPGVSQ